jgi:HSP20 family protein
MVVFPVARRVSSPLFNRSFGASLDALLDRRFSRDASEVAPLVPQMDVSESDTAYTIVLNAPGVTREQLKVSVQGRRVSIDANAVAQTEAPAAEAPAQAADSVPAQRLIYSERAAARYSRTIALPVEVDQASSQAKLENGVLTLTLTKKVPTGATQLSIN